MTRPSDLDRAHHTPLMRSLGAHRGVPPSDIEAIVSAFETGTITSQAGHKLIASHVAGKALPPAVAAFKPVPEVSAITTLPGGPEADAEAARIVGLHRREIPLATLTPEQIAAQAERNEFGEPPEQAAAAQAEADKITKPYLKWKR